MYASSSNYKWRPHMIPIIVILLMFLAVTFLILIIRSKNTQIEKLNKKNHEQQKLLEEQNRNLRILSDQEKAVQQIQQNRKEISQKIKEARSDDEASSIIADIINANNQRMQDG